jgi:DNA topoisomerase-2
MSGVVYHGMPVLNQPLAVPGLRTADSYSAEDYRSHALKSPDMFVGLLEPVMCEERLLPLPFPPVAQPPVLTPKQLGELRVQQATVNLSQGPIRVAMEIFTNACDNVGFSRRIGLDAGQIEISLQDDWMTVTSYGAPIPIERHATGLWTPEVIFGVMLTGSSLKSHEDRHEAGRNGMGSKLCNIFSLVFRITVVDASRGLCYHQEWRNNMDPNARIEPVITPCQERSRVTVQWLADLTRLGCPTPHYDQQTIDVLRRHAADISIACRAVVVFSSPQGICNFAYHNAREYGRLYLGNIVDKALLYYHWPQDAVVTHGPAHKQGAWQMSTNGRKPILEVLLADTPDAAVQISFVNGVSTKEGGVHVDEVLRQASEQVLKLVNEERDRRLTIADVRPHISSVIVYQVLNPKFNGNAKSKLNSPKPKFKLPEEILATILTWQLKKRLEATARAKALSKLHDSRDPADVSQATDANYAGTKFAARCILIGCEGKSSKLYPEEFTNHYPGGRNEIGIIPFRGKGLNVQGKDWEKVISQNKEVTALIQLLGLRPDVDYRDPAVQSTLRYGNFWIFADADKDGIHITGLLLNIFHTLYPSLLRIGFVKIWLTPIIQCTGPRGQRLKFYNELEYDAWRTGVDQTGWLAEYYKGLGTSNASHVAEDYAAPQLVHCVYDELSATRLQLAFDPDLADPRKEWLANFQPRVALQRLASVPRAPYVGPGQAGQIQFQELSTFVDCSLVQYGIANLFRSLPRLEDQLKESQRRVLYTVLSLPDKEQSNVRVVGETISKTLHHHGDASVAATVVRMAQSFIGASNLPYFTGKGNYGSRKEGAKVFASARYLYLSRQWWLKLVYRKEDGCILRPVITEGLECEPEVYYPILPPGLCNGVLGISTGHSTNIPNYHPLQLVEWILTRLSSSPWPVLVPWFRGFRGKVYLSTRAGKRLPGEIEMVPVKRERPPPEPAMDYHAFVQSGEVPTLPPPLPGQSAPVFSWPQGNRRSVNTRPRLPVLITEGLFTHDASTNTTTITELPIGYWSKDYEVEVLKWKGEKKITDKSFHNGTGLIHTILYGATEPTLTGLGLRSVMSLTNMVLLAPTPPGQDSLPARPVKYPDINSLMEAWFQVRYQAYGQRRATVLAKREQKRIRMTSDIQLLQALRDGRIKYAHYTVMVHEITALGLDATALDRLRLRHLATQDESAGLVEKLASHEAATRAYERLQVADIWAGELQEFVTAYRQHYQE